jgi:hypothetical protein
MTMRILIACVAILGLSSRLAAECGLRPPTCDALARATLVFYGEVLEETSYPNNVGPDVRVSSGRQDVRFNVLRAFKGAQKGTFSGTFNFTLDSVRFRRRGRFVVYAFQRAGRWETVCSRSKEMLTESVVLDELTQLDACLSQERR